jgi:hypothetical protein
MLFFYDKFETVSLLGIDLSLDNQWADIFWQIFWLGCECFLDVEYGKRPTNSSFAIRYYQVVFRQESKSPDI